MSDGFAAKDASGNTVQLLTDEVIDGTLGTGQKQLVGIVDATINGTNKLLVGTNGAAAVMPATDGIASAGVLLAPLRTFQNVASGQTDSVIVLATGGKKIRVLQVFALAGGSSTDLTFNSKPAGAGTAISPLMANDIRSGEVLPFSPIGWFETNVGEGLTVTTSAGSTTGILVAYILV